MSFSPDAEEIAAADRRRVYVWEVDTGLELLSFPIESEPGGIEIAYSPNGQRLAVYGGLGAQIMDLANGRQVKKLVIAGHLAAFYGLAWSPDGTCLSSATLQPSVVTWDVETGEVIRRFEVKKGEQFSHSPTMSADGQILLASTGGAVDVWRFATGEHLKRIETDADSINKLVLTPDQKRLVVGSQDGIIRILEFDRGELIRKIDGHSRGGCSIAVTGDFKTVALGAVNPTIRQWDLDTGEEKFPELTSVGHDAQVQCIAFAPDGQTIASGGRNKQVNLWDAETGKLRLKLASEWSANRAVFTRSGRNLLTSWQSAGVVHIWDVATGRHLRTIDSGMKMVRCFGLTPDEKQLVCVASNSEYEWHSPTGEEVFQLWDFESGEKHGEFKFATASTESAVLAKDGTVLVTGAANGIIHVMHIESGRELAVLLGHQHSVDSLALSPDGALLASGSADQTIRLWDVKTWKNRRVLAGHKRAVTSVAFSPSGRILASGSGKASYPLAPDSPQQIRFWDVDTGAQVGAFSGHDANTAAIAFAPDGRRLVSAHDNTTILVWDVDQMNSQ